MNVVSIMAHQDDEMRCLGTMLKCRARGDKLFFIIATDGSKGFVQEPTISRERAAAIRLKEMDAIARAVDGEMIALGEHDEYLYDTPAVRDKLIQAIRQTRADLIFTHYHEDYNLDHTTVHHLVRHCAMHSSLPVIATAAAPLKEHPAIFCVEPHGPIPFAPSHWVDITAFEDRKIELLRLHESQEVAMQKGLGTGFDRICRRPDGFWGDKVGCDYAEAFVPMAARGAIKPYPVLP